MTSSTGPPLPPWLTTRPPVSFFPGLRDLDIRPRVPFTVSQDTTSAVEETTSLPKNTLAPPAPSVAPHMDTVNPLSMCPPRNIRALSWSWSRPGSTASLACPPGTTGSASWTCSSSGNSGTPQWATPSPDLSDCQSLWMAKIIRELRKSELILGLASELMQYVSANPLYGGDVKSAVNAMTIITEKMQYQLEKVPTLEQREAMVMELVQATVTSQVVHLSLGGGQVVREPLTVTLEHKISSSKGGEARCVLWQPEIQNWNSDFCSTLDSNLTHSTCHCSRLGTFALLQKQMQPGDEVARMNFLVTVIIAISVSIVFFVSIILAFIYCYRMKAHQQLKLRLGRTDLSCLRQQKPWVLSDSPTITEDLFHPQEEHSQNIHNCGLLTLSSASLVRGGPYTSSPTHRTYHPTPSSAPQAPQPVGPAPLYRLASPSAAASANQHIYMEVDPLYCSHSGATEGGVQNWSGLHSSDSSQSSSGYSTGSPSDGGKFLLQQGISGKTFDGTKLVSQQQHQHLINLRCVENGGYTVYRVGGPVQCGDLRGHTVTPVHTTRRQLF